MEIQLPEIQSYLDKIKNGSITKIRLPTTEIKTGDVLTTFPLSENDNAIYLKVLASETIPLEAITAEEAEKEGFTAPGFCPSQFICGNIETRLDFEDYAFKSENGIRIPRSPEERELYLREKVQKLCPSCVTRKDAKDLFLNYWKSKSVDGEMTKINFAVIA
jgi:uncharacterized protein YqfB (UPF0267 family)